MKAWLLCLALCAPSVLLAQEDNWWRKLFRKEAVEEKATERVEVGKQEVVSPAPPNLSSDSLVADPLSDTVTVLNPDLPGRVTYSLPSGLDRVDSLYRESPPLLSGYRIQVYFGDLISAREQRKTFMAEHPELPCYLVQNPPNFAIQVGDYRTHLDAYREALQLKALYPAAIVVPSPIETPIYRRGGDD